MEMEYFIPFIAYVGLHCFYYIIKIGENWRNPMKNQEVGMYAAMALISCLLLLLGLNLAWSGY